MGRLERATWESAMSVTHRGRAQLRGALWIGLFTLAIGGLSGVVETDAAAGPGAGKAGRLQDGEMARLVNEALGLRESSIIRIDQAALVVGNPIEVVVAVEGARLTLDLRPHSVRAHDYKLSLVGGDHVKREVAAGVVRTYRGTVRADPGSVVAASLMAGGLSARILFSGGAEVWIEPIERLVGPGGAGLHVVYDADDVLPVEGRCGVSQQALVDGLGAGLDSGGGVLAGDGCSVSGGFEAELAANADFFYRNRWGDDTETQINAIINQMNVQYMAVKRSQPTSRSYSKR